MRRLGMGVAVVAISCWLAGCDSGTSTATPEEAQAGLDALKKLGNRGPTGKVPAPTSKTKSK